MAEEARPDRELLVTGPRSEDGLQAILGRATSGWASTGWASC